ILKKKKPTALPAAKKKVIVQEQEDLPLEPTYEPVALQAAPAKKSVGSTLDQGIQNKMSDVQTQFESALLKTLDRIKITVDDGAPAPAEAQAAPAAPAAP